MYQGPTMTKSKQILTVLSLVFFLFCLCGLSFAQEDFTREEYKLFQRYQSANKRFEKGKNEFGKGKTDKAEKEFNECLKIMPEHADAYFMLSQISYKKGDVELARSQMETAKKNYHTIVKMKMNMDQVRILKMQEARDSGRYDEKYTDAINTRLSRPVAKEEAVPADYHYIHGNILFKLREFQQAHDMYVQAITVEPKHKDAYNNLINIYLMSKQYQKGLDYLKMAEDNDVKINKKLKEALLKAAGK
jgi:tetratricopeptide (TPR) repeat protein